MLVAPNHGFQYQNDLILEKICGTPFQETSINIESIASTSPVNSHRPCDKSALEVEFPRKKKWLILKRPTVEAPEATRPGYVNSH